MLVGCASITSQTKEQVKTYNDTLHKQFFTLEEQITVGIITHTLSQLSPEARNNAQQQNEVLENMAEFWRSLQVSGALVAKRDAVATPISQLSEWKTKTGLDWQWKKPQGVTSTTDLEDQYLAAYTDFLKTVFPNGEVVPSYTAKDYGKAIQFYLQ